MTQTIDKPHVLIITEVDGEKEWRIVHPPTCPWNAYKHPAHDSNDWVFGCGCDRPEEHNFFVRGCLTEWEIGCNGIDGLEIYSVEGSEHIDPAYVPVSRFEAEWHKLKPGRYIIQATYSWSGSWYDEPDSEFYIEAVR